MRVTFVVPTARIPIGSATSLYQLANGLARRGHEVHVFHVRILGGAEVGYPLEAVEQLTWVDFEASIQHRVGETLDVSALPDADVVTCFDPRLPHRCGRPVVFVKGYGFFGEVEDAMLRAPAPKLCVARWLVDVGVEKGIPEEELVYLPNGLDHRKYRWHRRMADRPRRVTMYYGNAAKGAPLGLAALARVKEAMPEVEVHAFGNAPPVLDLPDWLVFHENPDQDDLVREIYNNSRVFLFPSEREGFGNASIEAMACGAALVTTRNGGSADYAFDGDTALVSTLTSGAPKRNAQALADHVLELLDDEERATTIARHGRLYVQRFDWELSASLLERTLQDYLADPERYGADR